jgi:methyl-accepting chemotaxis protein
MASSKKEDTATQTSDEICQIVSTTMKDFRESMDMTREMSIRIGKRTTQIIRMGMLSVFILGAVMTYLITTMAGDFGRMTEHMVAMTGYMESMEKNFKEVSGRMAHMDLTLTGMSQSVYVLPEINETMSLLGRNTYQMSSDMHTMVGDVSEMQTDVSSMSGSLDTMDRKVGGMNAAVHDMTGSMRYMNREMRDMSRPMDFFPLK